MKTDSNIKPRLIPVEFRTVDVTTELLIRSVDVTTA